MAVMKRDGGNGVIAYPKNIYTALANGAITAGDVVKVETDTSADPDPDTYGAAGFVVAPTAESNSALVVGVAVTSAADGEEVQVQTSGFIDTCTSAEAIGIGDMVGGSANGDIRQWDTEGATSQPFGVCVNAFAGTTNDGAILIIDKGWFY
jgi:predicted RecA/RadA family phage recombinase